MVFFGTHLSIRCSNPEYGFLNHHDFLTFVDLTFSDLLLYFNDVYINEHNFTVFALNFNGISPGSPDTSFRTGM